MSPTAQQSTQPVAEDLQTSSRPTPSRQTPPPFIALPPPNPVFGTFSLSPNIDSGPESPFIQFHTAPSSPFVDASPAELFPSNLVNNVANSLASASQKISVTVPSINNIKSDSGPSSGSSHSDHGSHKNNDTISTRTSNNSTSYDSSFPTTTSITSGSTTGSLSPPAPGSPVDDAFPSQPPIELPLLDDEGLNALEKVYLFSTSKQTYHRIFISSALPQFLSSVGPHEAVEYVLPLLTGLAMDPDESVKEALASQLVPIIWWFFTHCQVVSDESTSPVTLDSDDVPIFVQTFTPIFGTLLLSPNSAVSSKARFAVVDLLHRVRRVDLLEAKIEGRLHETEENTLLGSDVDIEDLGLFNRKARAIVEHDILQQVVIGMSRLDWGGEEEEEMCEEEEGMSEQPSTEGEEEYQSAEGSLTGDAEEVEDEHWNSEHRVSEQPEKIVVDYASATTPLANQKNINPYFPTFSKDSPSVSSSGSSTSTPSSSGSGQLSSSPSSSSPHYSPQSLGSQEGMPKGQRTYHGTKARSPLSTYPPILASRDSQTPTMAEVPPSNSNEPASSSRELFERKAKAPIPEEGSVNSMQISSSPSTPSSPVPTPASPTNISQPARPSTPPVVSYRHMFERKREPEPIETFDKPSSPPPIIDQSAQDAEMDDMEGEEGEGEEQAAIGRLSSMSLIAAVAVGGSIDSDTKQAFVEEVDRVGRDEVYWVRREASFAVGALAKVVDDEAVLQHLLPLFELLRQDTIWHVRHSALFALPAILARVDAKKRRTLALKSVIPLAQDDSYSVRSAVLEALGEVIYTFHADEQGPPEELVQMFLGRWEPKEEDKSRPSLDKVNSNSSAVSVATENASRNIICAFNYPAVALTLGQARWKGEFRDFYLQLTKERATKVRRTLAASLGEMAKIIGPENAMRDLTDVWWDAARSDEEEIRGKIVDSLVAFVQALPPLGQARICQGVLTLWRENHWRGWREREGIANALEGVARSLHASELETLRRLLKVTLTDKVAAVRDAAVRSISAVWNMYKSNGPALRSLREDVNALSKSPAFRYRMTFVACLEVLVLPDPQGNSVLTVDDDLLQTLMDLADDSILGVRIGVARLVPLIRDVYLRDYRSRSMPTPVRDLLQKLSRDASHEVRSYVMSERTGDSALHLSKDSKRARTLQHNASPSGHDRRVLRSQNFSRPPPPTTS